VSLQAVCKAGCCVHASGVWVKCVQVCVEKQVGWAAKTECRETMGVSVVLAAMAVDYGEWRWCVWCCCVAVCYWWLQQVACESWQRHELQWSRGQRR
jgi:hypothetical protein